MTIFVFFGQTMPAFAINASPAPAPGIKAEIKDLKAENQHVTGNLSLNNLSSIYYPQLTYNLVLSTPGLTKKTTYQGKTVSTTSKGTLVSHLEKPFSINNNAQAEIPFDLPYNSHLQSGNYSLTASIETVDQVVLGYSSSSLPIQTDNTGLLIDPLSCQVIVNGIRYGTADGPVIEPTDKALVECSVKNLNSQNISTQVSYGIDYAVQSVVGGGGQVQKTNSTETISFKPSEEKTVSFKIPVVNEPQVYEGYVYLLNPAKVQVSASAPFRWIVGGPSAHIQSINLDKDSYKAQDLIIASIQAYPSMDLYWRGRAANGIISPGVSNQTGTDLTDAKLIVTVMDRSGANCGSKEVTLPSTVGSTNWPPQTVSVTSSKDCNFPKVKTEVSYQGNTLASMVKDIPTVLVSPDLQTNPAGKTKMAQIQMYLAVMAIIIIGAIVAAIIVIKRRKKNKDQKKPTETPPTTPPAIPLTSLLLLFLSVSFLASSQSGYKIDVFAQSATPSATVSASPSSTPLASVPAASGDIVKPPINSPLSSQNIVIKRGRTGQTAALEFSDNYYINYTNFVQSDPSGSSSITADAKCGPATLKLVGYATGEYICGNKKFGIRYIITIDGKPAQISNVTSTDSNVTLSTDGSNSFDVWEFSGPRTADLQVTLPGGLDDGAHKIDIKVIGLGLTDQNHINNFYTLLYTSVDDLSNIASIYPADAVAALKAQNAVLKNCDSDGKCYGTLSYNWTCSKNLCGMDCTTPADCQDARDGCTVCAPNGSGKNTCQAPACGLGCTTPADCQANKDSCTACAPDGTGKNTCQAPACGLHCTTPADCQANKDGCTVCAPDGSGQNTCQAQACGLGCTTPADCQANKDGCTICATNAAGKSVCQAPACGIACTTPADCQNVKDGCTSCAPNGTTGKNTCQAPACGLACSTPADCQDAKDGCTACAPDTKGKNVCQTPYDENSCKCDGFNVINLKYPSSSPFQFEAFSKVEGTNLKSAKVESMSFKMIKSSKSDPNVGNVVAQSGSITPEVVSSDSGKIRYHVKWSTTPPNFDPNAIYRVVADTKCAPKPFPATAHVNFLPNTLTFDTDSNRILGQALDFSPFRVTAANPTNNSDNLQLDTLNFVKIVETDNCRFLRFSYEDY